MSGLDVLDVDIGVISSNPASLFGGLAMNGDEYVRCNRCGFGGCDLRVSGCGCTFHTRCMVLPSEGVLTHCTACARPTSGLELFPMSFREIDEARKQAQTLAGAQRGKGRKRKGGPDADIENSAAYVSERRTGRWTTEEMALCDKLIAKFESGELPISDGIKLNEFLGNMLKSKQSRLTKKMKNAKLSSRTFQRSAGGVVDINEAREFSELEDCFFNSLQDAQERAEIKFHMQREWREQFSQYCVALGQPLDADGWLSSVEEMDRRASQAKDAARMAKRKLMMGFALRTDTRNPDHGVFIEQTASDQRVSEGANDFDGGDFAEQQEMLQLLTEEAKVNAHSDINGKSSLLHSAPFLAKTIAYMQRHNVPFEHVDLWVPSFVPSEDPSSSPSSCRLCFAGSATVDDIVGDDGKTKSPLPADENFNLHAFGDYSQKFSFDVGCGLPGRVYESGHPTWEQSVQNAPHHHFERCGGALQWGIKTVLGIPIASPNVGRVVVIMYSLKDREKDQDLVARLSDEFTGLMPSPKWKLVVDVGEGEPPAVTMADQTSTSAYNQSTVDDNASMSEKVSAGGKDRRIDEVVSLLGEFMPSDPNSPLAPYLSGFMSLRLLLLRPTRSPEDEDKARTMLDSYSSYSQGGRARSDIGVMLARDYMFLCQQKDQFQVQQQQQAPFFPVAQGSGNNNNNNNAAQAQNLAGYPVFDIHNSPTLAPIGMGDSMSIVSN
eukprot:Nitzschia sp. Nitz4//scaffold42_size132992//106422//108774//NITZ4_003417-RA/size132992-augustus-gene-0.119-mRNA-1//-1//CDS//3329551772//1292//frame0